jgi:hypothetical protein
MCKLLEICSQNMQHKKASGTVLRVCVCVRACVRACVCARARFACVLLRKYVVGIDILEATILCRNFQRAHTEHTSSYSS